MRLFRGSFWGKKNGGIYSKCDPPNAFHYVPISFHLQTPKSAITRIALIDHRMYKGNNNNNKKSSYIRIPPTLLLSPNVGLVRIGGERVPISSL